MKTARYTLLTLTILAITLPISAAKRFFNLTAGDIEIDSILPEFHYAVPLNGNYGDSIYTVRILYPDYMPLSPRDTARYHAITSNQLPASPEIMTQTVVSRKKATLEIAFVPMALVDGKKQFIVSFMLEVESKPRAFVAGAKRNAKANVSTPNDASASTSTESRYAAHSRLREGKWVKISVNASGFYQLTNSFLTQCGFTNPDRVHLYGYGGNLQNEKLVGSELAATDDLPEVPLLNVGGKRIFYGRGPVSWASASAKTRTRNPYSDYGCYFLSESTDSIATTDSTSLVNTYYKSYDGNNVLYEVDGYAWFTGGRNLYDTKAVSAGDSTRYIFTNSRPLTTVNANGETVAAPVVITVATTAATTTAVSVRRNGTELGTINITAPDSYSRASLASKSFTVSSTASDTITLKVLSGGPMRLDYIIEGYSQPTPPPSFSTASLPSPTYVYTITNQDHHADKAVDMVIIIPTSQKLLSQAQRLADFHTQHDSMSVRIVPADELYNEFSSGTPDINAYRRYMKMLYDRAENEDEMPKNLLLFGDAVWDNRMKTSVSRSLSPDDYLLCWESENSFSEISCYVNDGWIALLDDGEGLNPARTDKEDIAIGRFPVTTEADAKTMVDKTIAYIENKNAGSWQNTLVFMGDDGNNNLHMRDVNEAAETVAGLHPNYLVKKIMWDSYKRQTTATGYTYPDATAAITQLQNQGVLIMDYAGHGSQVQISHEAVLKLSDFEQFNNTNYPLWITASCDIVPFDGTAESIGEAALLNNHGGAMAFYGTARTVYASQNKLLNIAFLRRVLSTVNGKPISIGEAQRLAKNDMIEMTGGDRTTNKLQYVLLGDPALCLNSPTLNAVIDSIDGVSLASGNMPTIKAGQKVHIAGHIENNGAIDSSFNGIAGITVRDTEELITCFGQEATTETPFTYYDRPRTLFNGNDSVKQGRFSTIFAVPMDINYADGTGKVNVYAVNNSHTLEANGSDERFYINGTDSVGNDSIGPNVYCYLNDPTFQDGGDVNTTPYFVAKISDSDGINASGTGIGHDMQLSIDGNANLTYDLNEHFSYDFGTYTSGSTWYSLPELTEGKHQLKFRVWDILNNCTTSTLNFNVVKGLSPRIFSISCTENPARETTTFIVSHNRYGQNVDLIIDVFDMSGRILWSTEASGVSTSNSFTVTWDLTTSNGSKLQTGVYLYRVRLSCDGSKQVSKAKKLVVISNN